ncbi:MAG: hypothetical protein HC902_13225 [Calothrix sp. SM1_5_4]|nr:hypothetical protein [Calothrix sp. SM1_5_4]
MGAASAWAGTECVTADGRILYVLEVKGTQDSLRPGELLSQVDIWLDTRVVSSSKMYYGSGVKLGPLKSELTDMVTISESRGNGIRTKRFAARLTLTKNSPSDPSDFGIELPLTKPVLCVQEEGDTI